MLQPDVLVARRSDLTQRELPAAPLLAVEVLSPSTSKIDQLLKPVRYAASGVEHYWVVDPLEPSLTAYEFGADGSFHEIALVRGSETYEASRPFEVSLTPALLVADV